MLVRPEGNHSARLRMFPQIHHTNARGTVHGGVTMALLDMALFATFATVLKGNAEQAVTLDLATQFIGAGELGKHSTLLPKCCAKQDALPSCAVLSNRMAR